MKTILCQWRCDVFSLSGDLVRPRGQKVDFYEWQPPHVM